MLPVNLVAALQNLKGFVLQPDAALLLGLFRNGVRDMERKERLNVEQAKQIDLVSYLRRLGYRPERERGNDHWYLSPLRKEKTASFKVNQKLNRWYDFGIGKGGNLIDFSILFFNCSVREVLEKLDIGTMTAPVNFVHQIIVSKAGHSDEQKITVTSAANITAPALIDYLHLRKIPLEIARKYCCQISYSIHRRHYYAIGFKNDSGGFEIRSKYAKLSSSPKAITHLKHVGRLLAVFEGFTDFLSFLALPGNGYLKPMDFLILNSTAFFEKSIPLMNGYLNVWLFLDRDATGRKCTETALALKTVYEDKSDLYDGFNDLNEWLVNKADHDAYPKEYDFSSHR